VHIALLAHSQPREVLVISGGAGGIIKGILKHPVARVDYTELDPLILKAVEKFPTALTKSELEDPRVNITYLDGRLYLKRTSRKYDLILIGLSNPSDLQVNRLFTQEFFGLAKSKLKDGGIVAFTLGGSLTYLNDELKKLNSCIIEALKTVFPYLQTVPGDFNLFLASNSKQIKEINPSLLAERLKKRQLEVKLVSQPHLEYRLHPRWRDWFQQNMKGISVKANRDFIPAGVFYSLAHWNALFSPYMTGVFNWFERINWLHFALFLGLLLFIFLLLLIKFKSKLSSLSVPLCIISTGFAGMVFDLVIIFAFQVFYGYVYYWIGLLVTAFMAGSAAGSWWITAHLEKIKNDLALFIKQEIGVIVLSALLPLIFLLSKVYVAQSPTFFLIQPLFLVLCFLSGLVVGIEFPLANKIYLKTSPLLGHTAGALYSSDLLGGWIGGILGGIVLLPILGLVGTCIAVVMLKVTTFIILIIYTRRKGN